MIGEEIAVASALAAKATNGTLVFIRHTDDDGGPIERFGVFRVTMTAVAIPHLRLTEGHLTYHVPLACVTLILSLKPEWAANLLNKGLEDSLGAQTIKMIFDNCEVIFKRNTE